MSKTAASPEAVFDYDVVVVGAGPTGLTTANLLGRYGVRALLVERNGSTVQEPRAVSIDDESLRTMQAIDAISIILPSVVAGYGSEYLTSSNRVFLKVEPTTAPYGYPRRNAFRQPVLEGQLRKHIERFASVDALFGWSLEALEQSATGVTATLLSPAGTSRKVRCGYLVAADGASSPIRTLLQLTLDGETFQERWLIVDLERSPAPGPGTMVFCDARRPCIALPGPDGTRRFEFKLVKGDDPKRMTDQRVVSDLLRSHGAAAGSEIRRKTIYTFHARVASQWSRGRVFLAGDACHLTPPFAGQGMNSGIRDAHNIAWKLAFVIRGRLPRSVLASYEQERRPHVQEMITLALRMGRIMGPRNRLAGFITQSVFRTLRLWPGVSEYFAQMKYKPKPRFSRGFLIPDGRPWRTTSVGRLIPQPRVMTHNGQVALDDVLGDGFALLCFSKASIALEAAASHPQLAALAPQLVLVVPDLASAPIAGPNVLEISDTDGKLAAGMDSPADRIFLVRPDRYVLGAFKAADLAAFANSLETLIGVFPIDVEPAPALSPARQPI